MSISHVLDVLRPSHSLSRLITCCPSLELLRSRANLLNRRILLTRFCFCGRPEDASAIQHQLTYQIVCNCGMHNDLLSTHIFCALCFLFFHSSPPRFTFNMFRSHYKYLHGNKPITQQIKRDDPSANGGVEARKKNISQLKIKVNNNGTSNR